MSVQSSGSSVLASGSHAASSGGVFCVRALRRYLGALVFALTLVPTLAHAFIWTDPVQPVAGHATRLVFSSGGFGGPYVVEAHVEGDRIVLLQRDYCSEICFSAMIPAVVEATVPPLAAGTYTLAIARALHDQEPGEAVDFATLEVTDGVVPTQLLPAEGFWAPVGQPGSGLFLERRGALLAVSEYTYAPGDGAPWWLLGTGTYSGDTVPLLVHLYADGDCLGCEQHRPARQLAAGARRLRFESARRAWLDVADPSGVAASVPMVSLPYGADYLPVTLTDTVDDAFGPLPLPDLRGTWLFAIEGPDAPGAHLWVELEHVAIEDGIVHFSRTPGGNPDVTCRSADTDGRAGCMYNQWLVLDPPPPEPFATFQQGGWFIPLGDIEEDRMRGVIEGDEQTWRVRGVRISGPPPSE